MKIIVLIATATLIGGCASTGAGSGSAYMPSEAQVKANNPYLLNCPANASPVCDVWGGRTRQEFTNCRCGRF